MLKWTSTILYLQPEEVITQMVPPEQARFMKGRDIYWNIHHCRTHCETAQTGFLLSANFEKAYDSITFEHALVMFELIGLPTRMLHLLFQLLHSPAHFCIQGTVVLLVVWVRRAGIRQGDPFSPAIFALLASAIILVLQKIHAGLQVTMYADYLVIHLSCDAEGGCASIVHCLREFGLYRGVRMNVGKSSIILKGLEIQEEIERLGLSISRKARYLGIMIGDATPQEVYAKAIAVFFVRAQFLRDLDLTPSEKAYLLNIWILTRWILPARVCYPTKDLTRQLRSILKMALGLDSWGLTLSEYGHGIREGGFSLFDPRNFLLFHHGTLFVHYLSKSQHFAVQIVQEFELWCESVRLNLSLTHLPTLQMAWCNGQFSTS